MWDSEWRKLLKDILDNGHDVARKDSKRNIREIISYKFHLEDPRDRLIYDENRAMNIFQCIGQFLWITQGNFNLEAIKYYQPLSDKFSSDGVKMIGAYGPRLFGIEHLNQMKHVADVLSKDPSKRRAVASVYLPQFDQHGLSGEEVPCTLNLQYLIREQKLQALTYMRSQDAFNVMPYDVFIFTMLQEYLQNMLKPEHDVELGRYNHFSGSFHVYDKDIVAIKAVIANGKTHTYKMEPMPSKDIVFQLRNVNKFESIVRTMISANMEHGVAVDFNAIFKLLDDLLKDDYWKQLGMLLICYGAIQTKDDTNKGRAYDLLITEYKYFVDLYVKKIYSKNSPSRQ